MIDWPKLIAELDTAIVLEVGFMLTEHLERNEFHLLVGDEIEWMRSLNLSILNNDRWQRADNDNGTPNAATVVLNCVVLIANCPMGDDEIFNSLVVAAQNFIMARRGRRGEPW